MEKRGKLTDEDLDAIAGRRLVQETTTPPGT
jgi:hypothetical protein